MAFTQKMSKISVINVNLVQLSNEVILPAQFATAAPSSESVTIWILEINDNKTRFPFSLQQNPDTEL